MKICILFFLYEITTKTTYTTTTVNTILLKIEYRDLFYLVKFLNCGKHCHFCEKLKRFCCFYNSHLIPLWIFVAFFFNCLIVVFWIYRQYFILFICIFWEEFAIVFVSTDDYYGVYRSTSATFCFYVPVCRFVWSCVWGTVECCWFNTKKTHQNKCPHWLALMFMLFQATEIISFNHGKQTKKDVKQLWLS